MACSPFRRPGSLLVAAAVFALLTPAASRATGSPDGSSVVSSDPIAEAVGRAVEFWGGTPCGGTVGVTLGPDDAAPVAGENAPGSRGGVAAMWAEWSTPAGINLFTEAPSSFSDCVVHINRAIWPTTQSEDAGFSDFCKEMVHELGHFEGYPDVGALPGTIQYERPDLATVPLCESFLLRFGARVYRSPSSGQVKRRRAQASRRRAEMIRGRR